MNAEKKILVVDDEPDIVAVLRDFLAREGYQVMKALSGEEALNILDRKEVDLVLLDIMMPGLNGIEIVRIAKEKYPHIKLVILTGFPDATEKLSKGNVLKDILIKPIKIQELSNHLVEILGRKEDLSLNGKAKQRIKARVLIVKAKLLFIESNLEIYNFLNYYFRLLSDKGEEYEIESVATVEQIHEKSIFFKPDIYLVNALFMKEDSKSIISFITERKSSQAEIIIYNIAAVGNIERTELEKITKAVKSTCLKNGLIDAKWIEI